MFKSVTQFFARTRVFAAGLLIAASLALPAVWAAPIALLPHATERAASPAAAAAAVTTTPSAHRIAVSASELAVMQPGQSFSLNIPGHTAAFEIVFDRTEASQGSVSWIGHLQGSDDYRAVITTNAGHSVGRIATPEGAFHIKTLDGVTTLTDLDRAGYKTKAFGDDARKPHSPGLAASLSAMAAAGKLPSHASSAAAAAPASAAAAPASAASAGPSSNATIDVMVLYNPSFVLATGNPASTIANLIAVANQAMIDSGVAITFRLVNTTQLNISDNDSNNTVLNKVTYPSDPTNSNLINDPVYAGVPALRTQYGADLVVVVRKFFEPVQISCGVAWTLTNIGSAQNDAFDAQYGYSVVSYGTDSANHFVCDNVTMAHEMGHNLGSAHDRAHATPNSGVFPYSNGYGAANVFATIMAANYISAPIVAKYSSPKLLCLGNVCGVAASDTTSSADNVSSLNLTATRTSNFMATKVVNTTGIVPATGYWWNPAEPGRGFNIEQRGNNLFLATFLYDAAGATIWYAVGPSAITNGAYNGALQKYAGGQTLTGPYTGAPQVVNSSAASFGIIFNTPTTGSITWPGGTIPIQRYEFVTGGLSQPPSAAQPQTGWWYAPTEGGRGFAIEIQANAMFLAGYMYDSAGNPVWFASGPAQMSGTGQTIYLNQWQQYGNGQTLGGAWKPAGIVNPQVGAVTIQFTSATTGNITFPDGHTVAINRYAF